MSSKNRPTNRPTAVQQQVIQHYSGPLPRPDILRGFESVVPGAAERIIKMAENEATHRHDIEREGQKAAIGSERFGMLCALVVFLVAMVGGFYCIMNGQPVAGTVVSSISLASIIYRFIQGRKK